MYPFLTKVKDTVSKGWNGTEENPAGFKLSLAVTGPTITAATLLTVYWTWFVPLAGDSGDNPAAKTFFDLAWGVVYVSTIGVLNYGVDLARNINQRQQAPSSPAFFHGNVGDEEQPSDGNKDEERICLDPSSSGVSYVK